ncbi:MAG: PIG-L deacetylase family protein [Mangrovibacterium sp.]
MKNVIQVARKKIKDLSVQFNVWWISAITAETELSANTILIISPHPDDEIIGLGGLIFRTLQASGKVYIVYLTDGEGSNAHSDEGRIKQERLLLIKKVLTKLRINENQIYWLHLKDGQVPDQRHQSFSAVSDKLSEIIDQTKPDAVLATHFLDRHPDHIACSQLAGNAILKSVHSCQLWQYLVWAPFYLYPWEFYKPLRCRRIELNARELKIKKELMDFYLVPQSPTGMPWSGYLPKILRSPLSFEIIEKIRI